MHINKLMQLIAKIDIKYFEPLDSFINSFLQEIMDVESYYDSGPKSVSTPEILAELTDKVDTYTSDVMLACAIEFCITNDYPIEEETWNCINYLLSHHKDWFSAKEKRYLKALNNSYMGIYKVMSVEPNNSVVLKDQIEKTSQRITVSDKSLSKSVEKGQYIAARILKTNSKSDKHELSASCFVIPPHLIKECVSVIRNITNAIKNPLAMQLFGDNEVIEDNAHNRLLTKKMWAKEILETWYLYYANYTDNQEMLDADGNPWHPCIIEFDLTVSNDKLRQALRFMPKLKFDENCKDGNTWLWFDKKYEALNNKYDNLGYHIFAEVKLHEDKLLIDVNSKQRANIAQDEMLTELGGMLSNPKIFSQS